METPGRGLSQSLGWMFHIGVSRGVQGQRARHKGECGLSYLGCLESLSKPSCRLGFMSRLSVLQRVSAVCEHVFRKSLSVPLLKCLGLSEIIGLGPWCVRLLLTTCSRNWPFTSDLTSASGE